MTGSSPTDVFNTGSRVRLNVYTRLNEQSVGSSDDVYTRHRLKCDREVETLVEGKIISTPRRVGFKITHEGQTFRISTLGMSEASSSR